MNHKNVPITNDVEVERLEIFENTELQIIHRVLDQNARILAQNEKLIELLVEAASRPAFRFHEEAP